jgi:glycosyltransferase involved in cell wall biosynthesis
VFSALVRRALVRYAQGAPGGGDDPGRVVILLSSAWGMGGTIRAAINLAGWLAQSREVEIITPYRRRDEPFFGTFPAGVTVTALADERPGRGPRGATGLGYTVLRRFSSVLCPSADRLRKDHSLWSDVQLVRRLRGRAGILIGTRPGLNIMIAQLSPPGFRTVGLEQMHLANHRQRLRAAIARWYPQLDALVALTEQDVEEYDRLLDGGLRLASIPNTVRPLGGPEVDPSTKVAVAAGRLGRLGQKGFDLLLAAWAQVAERHPDWRLVIHGEGELRPELESMTRELGLAGGVELPGAATDMGRAMAEGSVFVLSSRFEGFPLILLEAMSKGLACASFDCPTGPAEIIDHGGNGLIVPAEDVGALSRAIVELIEDERLRARLGSVARETAAEYEMAAIGPRWDQLLESLEPARERRRWPVAEAASVLVPVYAALSALSV